MTIDYGCCSPPIERINDRVDKFTKVVTNFLYIVKLSQKFTLRKMKDRKISMQKHQTHEKL